jgi:hypothetical protein
VLGVRKALGKTATKFLAADPPLMAPAREGVGELMEQTARVRSASVFHSRGVAFHGELVVPGDCSVGATLFDEEGRYDTVVRMSKAAPTPGSLPDLLGLAIRVLDAEDDRPFDLLLATSSRKPGLRHVPLWSRDFVSTYTSIAPYRVGGQKRYFAAFPQDDRTIRPSRGPLRAAVEKEPLVFRLALASGRSHWQPVATLCVNEEANLGGEDLCYAPTQNVVEGIHAVGWVQRMRRQSYRGSQEGRGARCPLGFRSS